MSIPFYSSHRAWGAVAYRDRRSSSACTATRGFTLIELMITLVIGAILLMIAVPSFEKMLLSGQLGTSVNDLIGSLNTARLEAIKTNNSVQFCSDSPSVNTAGTLGAVCADQVGAVVATTGTSATRVRAGLTSITSPIKLSGHVQALRYGGDGLARAVGSATLFGGVVADLCAPGLKTENHRQITMTGGSILTSSITTGACP